MHCLTDREYFELASRLAIPTSQQTLSFAQHVADNHSWYKHLPFFPPGAGFVFFLNPHAGCGIRGTESDFSVYEIERGEYCEHHSRLSTNDYRTEFGHWDYWVDDNPRRINRLDAPWIYFDADDQLKLLPSDVKREWSCRLTAFLRLSPAMFLLRQTQFSDEYERFFSLTRPPIHSRWLRVFKRESTNADSEASRYLRLAREIGKLSDPQSVSTTLNELMRAESAVQRLRVRATLDQIRSFCHSKFD